MPGLEIAEIQKLIPHRYPFLWIDKVLEIDPGVRLLAVKNLTANEPHFQGHFPQMPVMPGVLILEAIAQAGLILYRYHNENARPTDVALLGSAKSRFVSSAYPGDQLLIEATPVKFIAAGGVVKGVARVQDRIVCKSEITFLMKPAQEK